MALPTGFVWECRPGSGSDLNGGAYKAGGTGTDYSQQNSAQIAVTDAVANGTTTITSATANFPADCVDNAIYVAGGTGSIPATRLHVVSRTNSTTIVVDASVAASTGMTLNLGGALNTMGATGAVEVSGNHSYVKNTAADTLTTSTPGSGGPVLFASLVSVSMEGYSSVRGDKLATPTLDAGAVTGVNLFSTQGTGANFIQAFISLKADCQAGASNKAFNLPSNRSYVYLCHAFDAVVGYQGSNGTGHAVRCFAELCSTYGFDALNGTRFCDAKSCTTAGFRINANSSVACNIARLNGIGFVLNGHGMGLSNNLADSNSTYGFDCGSNSAILSNNLASNNTTAGYRCATNNLAILITCADYNNGARSSGTFLQDIDALTLSAQPFITAGSNFRPNTTIGGGKSLRAAGIGPYGQENALDVGAVQTKWSGARLSSDMVI